MAHVSTLRNAIAVVLVVAGAVHCGRCGVGVVGHACAAGPAAADGPKGPVTPMRGQTFRVEFPSAVAAGATLALIVTVDAYRPASSGVTGYTVVLRSGDGAREVRVGTFSVFPTEAFTGTGDAARRFIFSLAQPLVEFGPARGPAEVIIRSDGTQPSVGQERDGGSLSVASVKVETLKR